MEKETFIKYHNAFKEAGITEIVIRCEGGNRNVFQNDSSTFFVKDDCVEAIQRTRNYAKDNGTFDVMCIPYENIDTIKAVSITYEQGLKLMEILGNKNEKNLQTLLDNTHIRRDIKPGTANIDGMKDEEGNYILPSGSVGMVVK